MFARVAVPAVIRAEGSLSETRSNIKVYSNIRMCNITGSVGEAMLDSMRRFKAGIFQALAHPTRLAIVECLRHGETTVGMLCEQLKVGQANASQHLAVLRSKHILETRKEGNQIFYRLRDPLLGDVLDKMREYFFAHMSEVMEMLKAERQAMTTPKKRVKR